MDVSIIIVSYNTSALTRQTIRSVVERTAGVDYEIIVVDNASADGSAEAVREEFPAVRVIALEENIGFGRANNRGMEFARGRNIFFLNPDTIVLGDAVRELGGYLDANPGVGAVGGNLFDGEMRPAHSLIRLFPSVGYELDQLLGGLPTRLWYGRNREFNHTGRPIGVGYVLGADLMVRRAVLDSVGGFDERFFLFFEETELCYRIRRAGWSIVSVPSARIRHLEGKSFASACDPRRIRLFEQGRRTFYAIHRSRTYTRVSDAIYGLSIVLHRVVWACVGRKTTAGVWRLKGQILRES